MTRLCRLLPVIILTLAALPIHCATAAEKIHLEFGAYSGGFQALDITLDLMRDAGQYDVTMTAKPTGVIGYFLPWQGNYHTHGTIKSAVYQPTAHQRTSHWREDTDQYRITYRNGVLATLQSREVDNGVERKTRMVPDASYTKNTVDILTGVVQMLARATPQKGCSGSADVFDGKRRFRLSYTPKGTERLIQSRWNNYQGNALVCQVEMTPLLGYDPKKPKGYYKIQEEGRAKGKLPLVWLARLTPDGLYVPVKMQVTYEYGAMLLHLKSAK